MRQTLLVCATLTLFACSEPPPPPAPPAPPPAPVVPEADLYVLLVGGNGFKSTTTLADLRSRYGADAVVEEALPLGEGDTEPGAVIHPNDPTQRAYVHFVDANPAGSISAIQVRDPGSRWTGPLGIRIGTTSTELERLNGKPYKFLGFDWDYGGYVSNWADGTLARAFLEPGQLSIRLTPPELAEGVERAADYPAGDAEFASDLPAMREQPAVVAEIGLGFVPAAAAEDAPAEPGASADTPPAE